MWLPDIHIYTESFMRIVFLFNNTHMHYNEDVKTQKVNWDWNAKFELASKYHLTLNGPVTEQNEKKSINEVNYNCVVVKGYDQ